jgi:hypothetical protein
MTIKTLVAVALAISIIIILFTVTKVTTPSRFLTRAGTLFIGSSTDDWGAGTGATGNWEANYTEGRQ